MSNLLYLPSLSQQITFGKEYKLRSSLLRKFITSTVPPSLRSPHILSPTPCLRRLVDQFRTPKQKNYAVIFKNHKLRLSASSCFILRIFSKGKRVLIQETSQVASAKCCSTLGIFFFYIKEFHHLQRHYTNHWINVTNFLRYGLFYVSETSVSSLIYIYIYIYINLQRFEMGVQNSIKIRQCSYSMLPVLRTRQMTQ